MKCFVCKKECEDDVKCPVCGFMPVVDLGEDPDETERKNASIIESYRNEFLKKVDVGVIAYRWKDEGGKLVVESEDRMSFGKGHQLYRRSAWCESKFARIPDEEQITVRVSVQNGDNDDIKEIHLPNLKDAELQELGVELDKDMRLRLLLRNSTNTESSDWIPLFG